MKIFPVRQMLGLNPLSVPKMLVLFWMANMVGNVANWLFNRIAVANLSLSDFALVSLLISFQMVVSVVALTIQTTTNKLVAVERIAKENLPITNTLLSVSLKLGVVTIILFAALHPFLHAWLHYPKSGLYVLAIVLTLFLIYPLSWGRGLINAFELYLWASLIILVEGISKLVLGILGGWYPELEWLVYLAIPASFILSLSLALVVIKNTIGFDRIQKSKVQIKQWLPQSYAVFLLYIGTFLPLSMDIILVRLWSNQQTAEIYSLLNLIGKTQFFVLSSFIGMLVPILSARVARKESSRLILLGTVIFVVGSSGIGALLVYYFPQFTLQLIVGDKFREIAEVSSLYILAIGFLSACISVATYQVMHQRIISTYMLLIGILFQVTALFLFHDSLEQITFGMMISYVLLFGLFLIGYSIERYRMTTNYASS